MHIIVGILSILVAVVVILWRLNQAAQAAKGAGEAASEAADFIKRLARRRQKHHDAIRDIDDPREAAAVMMVAVAQYDGQMTEPEIATIKLHVMENFGFSSEQADELIAYARWATKDMGDLGSLFLKASPSIIRDCSNQEKNDLIAMLEAVASHSSRDTDVPKKVIGQLKSKMFLK